MIITAGNLAAFFTGLQTAFNAGLTSAASQWQQVAMRVPSASAQNDYAWLGAWPKLREWVGDKVYQNLMAYAYTIANKAYESSIEVKRDNLEDDTHGVYAPLATAAGQAAQLWVDENIFPLLASGWATPCYDGEAFFSATHKVGKKTVSNSGGGASTPWYLLDTSKAIKALIYQDRKAPQMVNQLEPTSDAVFNRGVYRYSIEARGNFGFGLWQVAYGSKQPLNVTNYAAARQAMTPVDEHGRPLGIVPNLLVVPKSLEASARAILMKEVLAGGESNEWYDSATLLVSPWL